MSNWTDDLRKPGAAGDREGIVSIWIVSGTAGLYSNRVEWVVAWHTTREAAEAHAKAAQDEAEALKEKARESARPYDFNWKTELDPFWELICYLDDAATYFVTEVKRASWPFPEPTATPKCETCGGSGLMCHDPHIGPDNRMYDCPDCRGTGRRS